MTAIVRIDDEVVEVAEFIRLLKLTGQFESLIEQLVRDKLTVHAAQKQGITVSADEIQQRADQFRRVRGLHRATDMNQYLDVLHVSLDEFEALDRKSTRLNSSHLGISYAVFCLKKKKSSEHTDSIRAHT